MNTGALTDTAERFTLGTRRGFTPTEESISDTGTTPFGLTLRTAPISRNGDMTMGTDHVTLLESDGSGADKDVDTDYTAD